MIYASLLAAVTGADDDADSVALAAELTCRHGASLRILTAFPIMESGRMVGAGAGMGEEIAPALDLMRQDRQRQFRAMVSHEADRFGLVPGVGIAGAWTMAETAPTPWLGLVQELPLSDLLVVGQSNAGADGPWTGFLADALMGGRTPVLVARGRTSAFGRPAAIAWDGSLQAGRAVKAALPMLADASEVFILQDGDGLDPVLGKACEPARLMDYLGHHGVGPLTAITLNGRAEGRALTAAAAEVGAALFVAGGFGHSRIREAVFGGATRSFLADADGPHLLLAH